MSFYEHNSADEDDDDYGGYFLRPVNEYKIADKIVLANKELFGEDPSLSTDATSLDTLPADSLVYPDEKRDTEREHATNLDLDCNRTLSVDSNTSTTRRVTFRPDLEDFEPDFITDNEDEEEADDDSVSESDEELSARLNNNVDSSISKTSPTMDNECKSENEPVSGDACISSDDECVDEIEEICEVIEDFDLAEDSRMAVSPATSTTCLPDVVDEDKASVASTSSASDSDNSQFMSLPKISTPSPKHHSYNQNHHSTNRENSSDILPPIALDTKPCTRHRRKKASSLNGICSESSSASSSNRGNSGILKIHLNFKPCCEYKHLENNRLPRYCGYFSQYGLSKEQLEQREARREKSNTRKSRRNERKAEEESMKSRINEEAFKSWLRLKMRNSHSGTRNMYDVRPDKFRPSRKM